MSITESEQRRRSVGSAMIGHVLEWYDFSVYLYLAGIIARQFYPHADESVSLLSVIGAFGVGYVARPVGAIVIGRLADTRGRRAAFLLCIFLMAGSTLAMAVLPTQAMVGLAAPVLLFATRLVQGFSAGGEWGVSAAYLVETAPRHRRGLYGSLQQVGIIGGIALGSASVAVLHTVLTAEQMTEWGWRLPFLVGSMIGVVGLTLRRTLLESPAYQAAIAVKEPRKQSGFGPAAQALGTVMVWSAAIYILVNYLPALTQIELKLSSIEALWANTVLLAVLAGVIPLMGHLSDLYGRKKPLLACCLALIVLPYPLFSYLDASNAPVWAVVMIQLGFMVVIAGLLGAGPAALAELFPTRVRVRWMTPTYTFAVVVIGALVPYLASGLIERYSAPSIYALYLGIAAVISGAEILLLRETAFDELA
jgi:MHS family proline/betaine transporter-like MFS transporter